MPECQARRTTSERANTVPRRANYAKYADERGGCDGGGGGARGNINMPPFTPHTLTTLFPPTSPSFLPSFPPSLPHLHAAARLGHAHIWEEGKEGRGEEKKGMRARRRQEARGREEKRMSSANAPDDRKRGRESERAGLRRRAVRLGHARECDGCFSASAVYRRHRCTAAAAAPTYQAILRARQVEASFHSPPVPPRMKRRRRRRRWSDGPTPRARERARAGWMDRRVEGI